MKINLSFITEYNEIRRLRKELDEKEARLITPLLNNPDDLALLYEIFKTLVPDERTLRRTERSEQRQKFVFIAICFFAPRVIAGNKVPYGLRRRLSRLINRVPSFISDCLETVGFQYQNIKAYREEVQYLCNMIEKELIIRGKL